MAWPGGAYETLCLSPLLRQDHHASYTLDIDATEIVAKKREAHYTCEAEFDYIPMVGHITELGLPPDKKS